MGAWRTILLLAALEEVLRGIELKKNIRGSLVSERCSLHTWTAGGSSVTSSKSPTSTSLSET